MDNAKLIIEVVAGVLPGTPEEELTRRYAVTSSQWQDDAQTALLDAVGKAQMYASYLMLQPERLNWVKTEWIWL